MSNYRQDIKDHIVENYLFGQSEELSDDTSFLDAGILDSTGVLQLVFHLEDTYNIKVEDDEMLPENLDSICAFIERKLKTAA